MSREHGKNEPHLDPQWVREELLRPSHYLGYDRDQLGTYFVERGAMELAESQFRRAAWLNPYEPMFRFHWAAVLLRLGRHDQGHDLLRDLLSQNPADAEAVELWKKYWPAELIPHGQVSQSEERTAPCES
jgi:hypothetical protein